MSLQNNKSQSSSSSRLFNLCMSDMENCKERMFESEKNCNELKDKLKHMKIISHRISKVKCMISTIFMIYKPSMEVHIKHRYKHLSHFDSICYKIHLGISVDMIYMYNSEGCLWENKIHRTHSIAPHIGFNRQIDFHNITYNIQNLSIFCIQDCIYIIG